MAGTTGQRSNPNHDEITLDLSAAAGPAAEERRGDDQGGQEDRKPDGRGGREGEGGYGAGTTPAGL